MTQEPVDQELILYSSDIVHICHIASLEVVRGVNKSFEIDHSGFSLANDTLTVSNSVKSHNKPY